MDALTEFAMSFNAYGLDDSSHVLMTFYHRGAQAGLSPGTDREVRTILEIMARCGISIMNHQK